jgi:hypothetical protein
MFIIFSAQVSMIASGRAALFIQYVASFQDSKWHEIYIHFNLRVLGLQEQNHLKVVAVIMTIVQLVVLLITLILLKRVIIAVAVIKVHIL